MSMGMRWPPPLGTARGRGRPAAAPSSSGVRLFGGGGAFGSTGSQNTTGGSDAGAAAPDDGAGADQAGVSPVPAASSGRTSRNREPRTVEAISAGEGTART